MEPISLDLDFVFPVYSVSKAAINHSHADRADRDVYEQFLAAESEDGQAHFLLFTHELLARGFISEMRQITGSGAIIAPINSPKALVDCLDFFESRGVPYVRIGFQNDTGQSGSVILPIRRVIKFFANLQ